MPEWTVTRIREMKGRGKIVCLTAYDFTTAGIADAAGIPLLLVGDSLATVMLGYPNTLPVSMEEMLHHTKAVVRGAREALVVADMPFMSYHISPSQAVANAGRFVKEAGADAVKIEGGAVRAGTVKALTENGIPVLGHIGLTPQSLKTMGGYKIQGRKPKDARRLLTDARRLEAAGAFAIVIECVPRALGAEITRAVGIPTIGIGAGPDCDGQILVVHDLLGMLGSAAPALKFVKRYANLGAQTKKAILRYKADVEAGVFPASEHSY